MVSPSMVTRISFVRQAACLPHLRPDDGVQHGRTGAQCMGETNELNLESSVIPIDSVFGLKETGENASSIDVNVKDRDIVTVTPVADDPRRSL